MATGAPSKFPISDYAFEEEARIFRRRVLAWLRTLHDPGQPIWQYRFFAGADSTVYTSCFALYLRHLLNDLASLTDSQKGEWIEYLQSFQHEQSGLFIDPSAQQRIPDSNHNSEHLSQQLTTFCLNALECLQARPLYPLSFVARWYDKNTLLNWLNGLNWLNPWNSGNKVMFVGIVLVYNYENFHDERAADALDIWFDWMDRHQKPRNGFWGEGKLSDYFYGMGGFYHQYLVYNYAGRKVHYEERVVDILLKLQQHDGLFFPGNGGGSCDDIDGIDPLVHSYHRNDYRRTEIRTALKKSLDSILKNQKLDGGFSWASRDYTSVRTYWSLLAGHLKHFDAYYWLYCNRKFFGKLYKKRNGSRIVTGWSQKHRSEKDSSLFDTWLRCTAIGEICSVLTDEPLARIKWQFLKAPGVGWFEPAMQATSQRSSPGRRMAA